MGDALERALSYLGHSPARATRMPTQRDHSALHPEARRNQPVRAPQLPTLAVAQLAKKLRVSDLVILAVSDISKRAIQRHEARGEPLSHAESDRILRIARVASEADRVFGNSEKAIRWLATPSLNLGAKPLEFLATDAGAHEVELELTRIDSGNFA